MARTPIVTCVLPAYNAARTLRQTLAAVTPGVVDRFILVDDGSTDGTMALGHELARELPLVLHRHEQNRGYGANQKTCYRLALEQSADVVVMLHPDDQYDPSRLGELVRLVSEGRCDLALGSRMLDGRARQGGMPLYKYAANRALTAFENWALGLDLSEYHTGYRAYSRRALEAVRWQEFSDDFIFDNQFIVEAHLAGLRIGELAVPARYFPEASSISFARSVRYGLGVLACAIAGRWRRRRSTR